MRVSVFGLGYVGAVSAACLARDGHAVVGCDIDEDKLALIRQGRSPIVEPGMEQVISEAVAGGRLRVTANAAEAVAASDVSLVCVGTPANPDGSQDLRPIRRLSADLGAALGASQGSHIVAVRSTVLPGTVEAVITPLLDEHSGKRAGVEYDVAFVPEFLREGSSLADYDSPPFTIIGVQHERAAIPLRQLYGHLPAELCVTSIRAAEMLKYCCNAFHALKVVFANEIGRIARAVDADADAVMQLFCKDRQLNLSAAYLRPGFAFGGPCLPKDAQALVRLADDHGVEAPLLAALLPSNARQIDLAVERILSCAPRIVGLLGISFKGGTDDLRTSPLVTLAQQLIEAGCEVRVYDPQVDCDRLMGANRHFAFDAFGDFETMMQRDAAALAAACDVLVVGRNDPGIVAAVVEHSRPSHTIVDLAGLPAGLPLRGKYVRA